MGYTTEFIGHFTVEPPLNPQEVEYLQRFSETRHMKRTRGEYHVDPSWNQYDAADVIDHNTPPDSQPGLWCQWVPSDDGTKIEWDGNEKFYSSQEWITYIIDNFLKEGAKASRSGLPEYFKDFTFDHKVSGVVECEGEDRQDTWLLTVEDNNVLGNRDVAYYG
jgi:hypothetical protein